MDHQYATLHPPQAAPALGLQNAGTIRLDAPPARLPGGFWRRVGAVIMDSTICSILTIPHSFVFGFAMGVSAALNEADPQSTALLLLLLNICSNLLSLVVVFGYHGWFYKHKGATPGKMLLRLRVAHVDTGTNLTYWRTFGRETLGKLLAGLLLGIGFLMVAWRRDKRGLHDLLLKTEVTYEPR